MSGHRHDLGKLAMPEFACFYRAMNNREPFPWQNRLADQVSGKGTWPDEIGVPTGLGKTACLDIAVWWLASQAHLSPAERTAPTRIWWVVNRRLLIDSTFDHVSHIKEKLLAAHEGVGIPGSAETRILAAVAARLSSLSAIPNTRPLEVVRLRGGLALDRPRDPSQPTVILSTVPMFGSRLLFRGYGTSTSMRSIDAALAGTDSLVLLDEAHLARHLPKLLTDLEECAPSRSFVLAPERTRPRLVELTATGIDAGGDKFDLEEEDRKHPVVKRRLLAAKTLEARCFEKGETSSHMVNATQELIDSVLEPSAFLVFANTPATARSVFNGLLKKQKAGSNTNILLLTGRMREFEAERVRAQVMDDECGMASGRCASRKRDCHLVVVATQTLEVGADIDAEFLVTEACSVRALTQRLGRLNRMGRFPNSRAIYVHVPPKGTRREVLGWPVYGTEPETVLKRLQKAQRDVSGTIDVCSDRVASTLGPPDEQTDRAPEILFGLFWEWLKTTTPPIHEAPVEPYFSGIASAEYAVSLIWRVHVPSEDQRLWPRFRDIEAIDVPIAEVRGVLGDDPVKRAGPDCITVESCAPQDLKPGDLVILSADRGMLDEFGWAPRATKPVHDASLATAGLPLEHSALRLLLGQPIPKSTIVIALGHSEQDDDEHGDDERSKAVEEIRQAARDAGPPVGWDNKSWIAFVDGLSSEVVDPGGEVPRLETAAEQKDAGRLDEFDEMSSASAEVSIESHCRLVAVQSRCMANRIGLSSELKIVLELAGKLHDIGKADQRFQRWLNPYRSSNGFLSSKSNVPRHLWERNRVVAGWPRGGRHEALSARLVKNWLEKSSVLSSPESKDLLLHLIVAHHGKGRPLVVPVEDETLSTVAFEIEGTLAEASAMLSETDWEQPARFRRLNEEFGPWGLALLETVLRQADHLVSSAGS